MVSNYLGSINSLAELSYQRYLTSQQNQSKVNDANLLNIPGYSLLGNENPTQQADFYQGNNNNYIDDSIFLNNKPMSFLYSKYQDDVFVGQLYKSRPWIT